MTFRLSPKKAALAVIDVQEKLYPLVEHACPMLEKIQTMIKGCTLVGVPTFITEQYPKGLGATIKAISDLVPKENILPSKTLFSGAEILPDYQHWIIVGIEAHVCVQQTVYDLVKQGKEVVVINDAISSRSIYDFATAIAEIRDYGARVTSVECALFELFHDAKHPNFKELSNLIK